MVESGLIDLFAYGWKIAGFMRRKGEMRWGSITILELSSFLRDDRE